MMTPRNEHMEKVDEEAQDEANMAQQEMEQQWEKNWLLLKLAEQKCLLLKQ